MDAKRCSIYIIVGIAVIADLCLLAGIIASYVWEDCEACETLAVVSVDGDYIPLSRIAYYGSIDDVYGHYVTNKTICQVYSIDEEEEKEDKGKYAFLYSLFGWTRCSSYYKKFLNKIPPKNIDNYSGTMSLSRKGRYDVGIIEGVVSHKGENIDTILSMVLECLWYPLDMYSPGDDFSRYYAKPCPVMALPRGMDSLHFTATERLDKFRKLVMDSVLNMGKFGFWANAGLFLTFVLGCII